MTNVPKHKFLIVFVFAILLLTTYESLSSSAIANPEQAALITVYSPQKEKTYFSTGVQLSFATLPQTVINLASFSYSLDGNARVSINGNSTIADLSYGPHTLTIYGNGTYIDENDTSIYEINLALIHFNIYYSTVSAILFISSLALVCAGILAYFKRREQIVYWFKEKKYKGEKSGLFWIGLLVLAIALALFILGVITLPLSSNESHFSSGDYSALIVFLTLGFSFVAIGLYLMIIGIKGKTGSQIIIKQEKTQLEKTFVPCPIPFESRFEFCNSQ